MSNQLNEEQFLALAKNNVRRVQTAEGAKFYGLPIGSIITADVERAKKAEAKAQGKTAPKGGVGPNVGTLGTSSQPAPSPSDSPDVVSPTISGPNTFDVGQSQFSAPTGSRVFRSKKDDGVVYVLTPDNAVHVFNESGEVPVPEYMESLLSEKFSKLKGEDPLYVEETFGSRTTQSLADEAPGAVLSKNGSPAFVKQGDGTWLNSDLGASLSDDDLQTPFADGLFELQSAQIEEVDFSLMTVGEIESSLDSFPEGKELSFAKVTLTKDENGLWVSSATGAGTDSNTIAQISVGTNILGDKPAADPVPDVTEKSGSKKDETVDPLLDPENEINEANTQKQEARSNLATGADVLNAELGAVLYHDELGKLTKVEDHGWENEERTKLFSEATVSASTSQGHVSKKPWRVEAEEDTPEVKTETTAVESEASSTTETPQTVANDAPVEEDVPEISDEDFAEMEAAASGIQMVLTLDDLQAVPVGSQIESSVFGGADENVVFTKLDNGEFLDSLGFQYSPDDLQVDAESGYLSVVPSTKTENESTQTPTAMSKDETNAAVEALSSHSGFQIKYGLKSLPDSHPLKNDDYLKDVVDDAKKKFPNLSPKQALLASLQPSEPEPLAEWEKELLYGDDGVRIGSENPKNTATGVTGGFFTKQDIQSAINLLESFEGKAFKSYLNKNGNPLGQLSPNDIVGFNKDKTITKNNFLALLKKKMSDGTDVTPEPVGDIVEMPPTLEAPDLTEIEPVNLSMGQVTDLPVGTKAYYNGGEYTKTAEDEWSVPGDSGTKFGDFPMWQTFSSDGGWSFNKPENSNVPEVDDSPSPSVDSPESTATEEETDVPTATAEPNTWVAGQTIKSLDEMKEMPTGTVLRWTSSDSSFFGPATYTVEKQEDGNWRHESGSVLLLPNFSGAVAAGLMTYENDSQPVDAPEIAPVQNGHVLISDPSAVKIGGQAGSNEGGLYELDTDTGVKKFYVKKAQSQAHGANENLANALYRELGVKAPNVDFASDGNLYSEIVDGEQNMSDMVSDMQWLDKVQKDFAIDAWLSNRDVFGMVYDNILTDAEGNPWRIDNGGALQYRAMGEVKTDFSNEVTEIEIFRKGKKAAVFGPDVMPLENELDGAKRLQKLTPERIRDMVEEYDVDSDVADILIARRAYLMNYYDLESVETVEPEQAPAVHSIAPGKYNTGKGAKAHLWVSEDGTGVYQGMKGILKPLDAEGVKKNYDAGMSTLITSDLSGFPQTDGESVAPNKITGLGSIADLPDGTYTGPKGETYVVTGDTVSLSKVVTSAGGLKLGAKVTKKFLAEAPVGTKVRYTGYSTENLVTKMPDGTWEAEVNASFYKQYMGGTYNYYAKRYVVDSFPEGSAEQVTKSSLKTKYLQGQLMDSNTGTSVLPSGHAGNVFFYGAATTMQNLKDYRDFLADPDEALTAKAQAHISFAVPFNEAKFKESLPADVKSNQGVVDALVSQIDTLLAGAKLPEKQKAADLFVKDAMGYDTIPTAFNPSLKPKYYDSAGQWSTYAQSLAAAVGDGSVVGTNVKSMTKDEKSSWVAYVLGGDFKSAYSIELDTAKSKGKPLANASAHPGHPSNKSTHKVKWSALVPGEYPAGHGVEGEWSTIGLTPSEAEVDNYLIAAKMQNPMYLDKAEKRSWMNWHRQGNKSIVDSLSATALSRKNSGYAPKSEEPVWSDEVELATSYGHLFDSTAYPQSWLQNLSAAGDYYAFASPNEPELVAHYEQEKKDDPYTTENRLKARALNGWFKEREEAYLEELNKPVYHVVQTISSGTHQVYIVADQFDRKKIFKPLTPGKEWRAENSAAAHSLAAKLGFSVPSASMGVVNEGLPMGTNYKGILMDFAPNVGSFGDIDGEPVNVSNLTPKQWGQLASEHVLDWFLDNDDTHSENMLLSEAGDLIAIDKDRALLQYGHWFGLDVDNPESLNVNTKDSNGNSVVYHQMVTAIKSGSLSQEQLDAAYYAASKSAKRIQKTSDAWIEQFVRDATASRTNWEVPDYAQEWPTLFDTPTSQDELVASVLARKNSMVDDIEQMWTKLYASSGLTKPEKPAKLLGEGTFSGWEEADLISSVQESKVWGTSPVHASADFANGSSLLWTEVTPDRKSKVTGKFMLGKLAQQKVVKFFSDKVNFGGYASAPKTELSDYPTSHVKALKKTVTAAAKNISANATSGNYDPDVWKTFKDTEAVVDADLSHAATGDLSSVYVKFPSGVSVPQATVPQYVMALQHHKQLADKVNEAKKNGVATDKSGFKDFEPPYWLKNGATYTNVSGESYKATSTGTWLHFANGTVESVFAVPDTVKPGEDGWSASNVVVGSPEADTAVYTYQDASQYAGTLNSGGIKTLTSTLSHDGHYGHEVRVDLPTGEKIFFRNGNTTGTLQSQQGMVRFDLNPDLSPEESLANAQAHMERWGINFEGASEETAEALYWRQMFRRILGSNGTGASSKVNAVREELISRHSDLAKKTGNNDLYLFDLPEAIAEVEENEVEYWRNLAMKAWGADRVNSFLAEGGHLPQYQHMDLSDPEKPTGVAYFNRIDVSLEELYATNSLVAIGNSGKDDRHFDYIKAGGMISTEERLRILGVFKQGTSSTSDQESGGANGVFARVARGSAKTEGALFGSHVAYWSPAVFQQTFTYAFSDDMYGRITEMPGSNPTDATYALKNHSGTSNEVLIHGTMSLYDYLEIMVFEDEKKRLKAIEEFKKLGIEMLRGVPIEDRLVLRVNLTKAMNNVKKAWS